MHDWWLRKTIDDAPLPILGRSIGGRCTTRRWDPHLAKPMSTTLAVTEQYGARPTLGASQGAGVYEAPAEKDA